MTSMSSKRTEQATHSSLHASSPCELLVVFAVLVGLTIITVIVAEFPTGEYEIWISLGIASIKATLVAGYFMHLFRDKFLNTIVIVVSMLMLILFLGLTIHDLSSGL